MIIEDAMIFYRDLFVIFQEFAAARKEQEQAVLHVHEKHAMKAQLEMLMIQRMCR